MYNSITYFNYIIVGSIWPLAIFETKLGNLKVAILLTQEIYNSDWETGNRVENGDMHWGRGLTFHGNPFCSVWISFLTHVPVLSFQSLEIQTFRKRKEISYLPLKTTTDLHTRFYNWVS